MASVNGGDFGFVCDDGFDIHAARAACKQLGLLPRNSEVSLVTSRSIDLSTRSFVLDDVICQAGDDSLTDCITNSATHNCGSTEGIIVSCVVGAENVDWTPVLLSPTGQLLTGNASSGLLGLRRPNASPGQSDPVCATGMS